MATYEAVLARWATGDYSEHTAYANFPAAELRRYASTTFKRLKVEQASLLQERRTAVGLIGFRGARRP